MTDASDKSKEQSASGKTLREMQADIDKLGQLRWTLIPLGAIGLGLFFIICGAALAVITPTQLERSIFVILSGVLVLFIGIIFLFVHKSRMVRARAAIDEPLPTDEFEKARRKIQYYMHENLMQVKHIYWLTVGAMLLGFVIIICGAAIAYKGEVDKKTASIVVTLSGVLVQFIGATFLIVYKSINEQARRYVEILERIYAVGMSVDLIKKITSNDERNKTRAKIASDILSLHGLEKRVEKQETAV